MNKSKNKVESKYKNPDAFIEKLKREVKYADQRTRNRTVEMEILRKEKEALKVNVFGNLWFSYKDPGHEIGVNLSGNSATNQLDNLKLGTKIICFGEVTEFTRGKSKNEASMVIKDVYLKR
jgi:hypothetical protein